jgi:hypothetical protein
VVAGISAGAVSFSPSGFRHAIGLGVAIVVAMILLDLLATPGVLPGGGRVGAQGGAYVTTQRLIDFTDLSLFRTAAAFLRGDITVPAERLMRYEPGHPLILASQALQKAGHLTLTLSLIGVLLGIQAWVGGHVRFRHAVDERVARIVVAWVVAPSLFFFSTTWAQEERINTMMGAGPVLVVLLPFIAVGLVGGVGWYAAWRSYRWIE